MHKLGANLDALDCRGQTPLIVASLQGYVEVVKVLHEVKADLNLRSHNGRTAIFSATASGHTEVLKVPCILLILVILK